ncbi:MAG: hypothetical protein LBU06_04020, partial [Desulfovibrio sp.]|nr:hypothetical protein [Desulfovibrio sp.]
MFGQKTAVADGECFGKAAHGLADIPVMYAVSGGTQRGAKKANGNFSEKFSPPHSCLLFFNRVSILATGFVVRRSGIVDPKFLFQAGGMKIGVKKAFWLWKKTDKRADTFDSGPILGGGGGGGGAGGRAG